MAEARPEPKKEHQERPDPPSLVSTVQDGDDISDLESDPDQYLWGV